MYHLPRSGEPVVGRRDLGCVASLLGGFRRGPGPRPGARSRGAATYSEVGQRALAEHRYPEAEQAYEKLRELSPETAEVHAGLGLIYYQQRKFALAIPPLRQAMKLNPNLPRTDILLALCLSELGQYKEAVPGLRKAFKQTADDPLRRLAGLQLHPRVHRPGAGRQGGRGGARADPGLSERPRDPVSLRAAALELRLPDDDQARPGGPGSAWTHQAAGEANESQGLYEAAVREYREVLTLDEHRPGIHFRIGRPSWPARRPPPRKGRPPLPGRGEKELERELALDPTNATAAYELGEIHRACGRARRGPTSLRVGGRALSRLRTGPVGLGRVLLAAGKVEPAPAQFEGRIAEPEDDVAYYQLSRAYQALGNADSRSARQVPGPARAEARAGPAGPAPPARRDATAARCCGRPHPRHARR